MDCFIGDASISDVVWEKFPGRAFVFKLSKEEPNIIFPKAPKQGVLDSTHLKHFLYSHFNEKRNNQRDVHFEDIENMNDLIN